MSPRLAARREGAWRRYQRDRDVRLERGAGVLVDEFHQGLGLVVEEFLSPEDHICCQQVHKDSVAVTTIAKEKNTPNILPSFHLIGQQPTLPTSPLTSKTFYQQIIPYYLLFYHRNQLSPSYLPSDV